MHCGSIDPEDLFHQSVHVVRKTPSKLVAMGVFRIDAGLPWEKGVGLEQFYPFHRSLHHEERNCVVYVKEDRLA